MRETRAICKRIEYCETHYGTGLFEQCTVTAASDVVFNVNLIRPTQREIYNITCDAVGV